MIKLKGELTISGVTTPTDKHVTIRVEDETSGCMAVEVTISMEQFAQALMNLSNVDCEYFLNTSGLIGKQHEHKTLVLPLPINPTDEEIESAIKPHETDGWEGRRKDANNHHNWVQKSGGAYRIIFDRFV